MPANVWVVLVNYNGLDDTRACLRSLAAQTAPHAAVVVDNASAFDPIPALRDEFPGVDLLRSRRNGGWAGGNNLGLRHTLRRGAELVVLLNNDTVADPRLVERLAAAAAAHPRHGVLGPVILDMEPPHAVQTEGVVFNRPERPGFFQRAEVPLAPADPPGVVDVDIVNGCCLMVRRAAVRDAGLVDEGFFLIHEESDFCLRVQRAGWMLGVVPEALVRHKGSQSFRREGKGTQRYYDARNIVRILMKHWRGPGRRPLPAALGHHLRYCFHRYALERDAGFRASAEAVVDGLYDAYTGRYGPRRDWPRPGASLLRRAFDLAYRSKYPPGKDRG